MIETIKGKLEIKNSNGSGTAIVLNGDAKPQKGLQQTSSVISGKIEPSFLTGQLDLKDASGKVLISFIIKDASGSTKTANAFIDLLESVTGESRVLLSSAGQITIGGLGQLTLRAGKDEAVIQLDSVNRSLTLNGPRGKGTIRLDSGTGEIAVDQGLRFEKGALRLGSEPDQKGHAGELLLRDGTGTQVIQFNAKSRMLHVQDMLKLEKGVLRVGSEPAGGGADGKILVRNAKGDATIEIDGKAGDILLHNADCAEEFDVVAERIEPGTVMVLCDDGQLQPSNQAYDKKVAGVVSGAGAYRPGLVLDKQPGASNRLPVALMGKVYCKVDAQPAAITVGDLLTTAPTVGHAMKATDPGRAFGAVIGKALRPLTCGTGLIPVLVALQ